MKLYLGNQQNVELDLNDTDIINLAPTAKARGGYWNITEKNAFRVEWYTGVECNMKYFYYKTSQVRSECYTYEEAEAAAKEHYEKNNIITEDSIIPIMAKDITPYVTKHFRYIQPIIDYDYQEVPIDSRWFGMWLGDGNSNLPIITNIDPELIQYIYDHAASINMKVTNNKIHYNTIGIKPASSKNPNPLTTKFRAMNLIKNKHIPDIYLYNSREVRLELLAGLMDTDGYLASGTYEIIQKSEQLAHDIQVLANGLGFFTRCVDKLACATNTVAKKMYNYKRITIHSNRHSPKIPVLLERKRWKDDQVKNECGIPMSLEKSDRKYKNPWSDEMKEKYAETVAKYTVKGRVQWTQIVKNEPLYSHITGEAMRNNPIRNQVDP